MSEAKPKCNINRDKTYGNTWIMLGKGEMNGGVWVVPWTGKTYGTTYINSLSTGGRSVCNFWWFDSKIYSCSFVVWRGGTHNLESWERSVFGCSLRRHFYSFLLFLFYCIFIFYSALFWLRKMITKFDQFNCSGLFVIHCPIKKWLSFSCSV